MGCHKGQGLKQDILFKHHIGIPDQIKVAIPSVDSQVMSCTVAEIAMLAKQFYEPGMGLPFLAGQVVQFFLPSLPRTLIHKAQPRPPKRALMPYIAQCTI